jgi:hypothetical protein
MYVDSESTATQQCCKELDFMFVTGQELRLESGDLDQILDFIETSQSLERFELSLCIMPASLAVSCVQSQEARQSKQ